MNEENENQKSESGNGTPEAWHYTLRKLREDSTWNRLTPEQRQRLERWLFEENLGYAKTASRMKEEFGIDTTIASVSRCYHRLARERKMTDLMEAQLTSDKMNGLAVDTKSLRTAAVKLTGKAALKMVVEKPEEVKALASITKLLLESERNDLRRGRLEFAQRCFDYEAAVATLEEFPQVRAFLQSVEDDNSLNNYDKIKKVQAMLYNWEQSLERLKTKFNHGK